MPANWPAFLLFSRHSLRALHIRFLTLIMVIAITGCVEDDPETIGASDNARNFTLNENFISELSAGNREDACDYTEVLPQLLSQIGSEANIYPSENYYYFTFNRAGSLFSGSLRLSSDRRDNGEIDYICYEAYRSWVQSGDEIRVIKHLSSVDDVTVEKLSPLSYMVEYGGLQTRFSLHQLDHTTAGSKLLKNEIRVGRSQDESGAAFELIFNSTINDFYFLLDLTNGAPDQFVKSAPNTVISRRTGFVYYYNPTNERYLLVAVNRREAILNSPFDGPSDHLPENDYIEIEFWDYVHKAYPDMIGKHTPGGTISADGMIFSIMPYRLYRQTGELGFIETCAQESHTEIDRITCMIWGF